MLPDSEIKMQALRRDLVAADAEIEAGLGKEYAHGADLLKDVMDCMQDRQPQDLGGGSLEIEKAP